MGGYFCEFALAILPKNLYLIIFFQTLGKPNLTASTARRNDHDEENGDDGDDDDD